MIKTGPAIYAVLVVVLSLWVGVKGATIEEILPQEKLVPVPRLDLMGATHGFSPAELKIAKPTILFNGCLVAQSAVRYKLRPAAVWFDPCGDLTKFDISLSDDLKDISVSGIADLSGTRKPFIVAMQHFPSAIWVGGYIVNEVDLR
jgi:hypothetical protein